MRTIPTIRCLKEGGAGMEQHWEMQKVSVIVTGSRAR